MAMKLEDLIPQEASVTIGEHTLEFRKINLSDEVWIKSKVGDLQKMFTEQDFDSICKLAFRLLKDKKPFMPVKIKDFDDNGSEIERLIPGHEMIQRSVVGVSQKMDLLWAIYQTFGISRPEAKEGEAETKNE